MILQSRITQENLSIGNNTHELVINRLIELWNQEPEKCLKLFNDVAERLAKYDNPIFPPVYLDKTNNIYRFQAAQQGKKTIISNKNYEIVAEKRRKFIEYNK